MISKRSRRNTAIICFLPYVRSFKKHEELGIESWLSGECFQPLYKFQVRSSEPTRQLKTNCNSTFGCSDALLWPQWHCIHRTYGQTEASDT